MEVEASSIGFLGLDTETRRGCHTVEARFSPPVGPLPGRVRRVANAEVLHQGLPSGLFRVLPPLFVSCAQLFLELEILVSHIILAACSWFSLLLLFLITILKFMKV
jgi:hypothetical protein